MEHGKSVNVRFKFIILKQFNNVARFSQIIESKKYPPLKFCSKIFVLVLSKHIHGDTPKTTIPVQISSNISLCSSYFRLNHKGKISRRP